MMTDEKVEASVAMEVSRDKVDQMDEDDKEGSVDDGKNTDTTGDIVESPTKEDEMTTVETLDQQNEIIYGTISHDIADLLANRIDEAIDQEVIQALPLLQNNEEGRQRLKAALYHKFVRNVDVLEAYCDHHVMTVRQRPVSQRKRIVKIVQLMRSQNTNTSSATKLDESQRNDEIEDALNKTAIMERVELAGGYSVSIEEFHVPNKTDIPSPEQLSELDTEMETIKEKLVRAKDRRNKMLVNQKSSIHAESVVTQAAEVITSAAIPLGENTAKVCSDRISQGQEVGDLTAKMERTVEQLDALKRDQPTPDEAELSLEGKVDGDIDNDTEDMTMNIDPLGASQEEDGKPVHPPKRKRLSLEESYQRDKKELLGLFDRTNEDLAITRNLLKAPRRGQLQSNQHRMGTTSAEGSVES